MEPPPTRWRIGSSPSARPVGFAQVFRVHGQWPRRGRPRAPAGELPARLPGQPRQSATETSSRYFLQNATKSWKVPYNTLSPLVRFRLALRNTTYAHGTSILMSMARPATPETTSPSAGIAGTVIGGNGAGPTNCTEQLPR